LSIQKLHIVLVVLVVLMVVLVMMKIMLVLLVIPARQPIATSNFIRRAKILQLLCA
tara:strand:- start:447 stop:614 length:168 start_codon:yes stop_codon:yes gene_type:complete